MVFRKVLKHRCASGPGIARLESQRAVVGWQRAACNPRAARMPLLLDQQPPLEIDTSWCDPAWAEARAVGFTRARQTVRRWSLAVAASMAFHMQAIVLCQLDSVWPWSVQPRLQMLPVEQGRASIDLIATIDSVADAAMQQAELAELRAVVPVPQQDRAEWTPQRATPDRSTDDQRPEMVELIEVAEFEVALLAMADRSSPATPDNVPPEALPPLERSSQAAAAVDPGEIAQVVQVGETAAQASQASPQSTAAAGSDAEAVPRVQFNPAPQYPAELLRARITGRVVLRVTVSSKGRVTAATVYRSSGVTELDEAALAAIWQWRFEPARPGGVAADAEVAVPIRFTIAPNVSR